MGLEILGQICRGFHYGEFLYNLVKQNDVHIILDIGTCGGLGSTKCILDGIIDSNKKNFKVFSIECNKLYYETAKINLRFLPLNFNLLHGSLFPASKLYSKRKELDNLGLSWLEKDITGIQSCQNVYNQIPDLIDLIIIDGGEFSGEIEFELFWKKSKYIFLDDINSTKNKNNVKFILSKPDIFNILYHRENILVCKNKNFNLNGKSKI